MSFNYNKVFIGGNLTRDPQVRFFANERAVADFGIAVNRRWKSPDGEMKEETTFVDVECWGRTAELVGQYLTKGRGCFIEGRLKFETWDDKETGQKRSKLKIIGEQVQFTDASRPDGQRSDASAARNGEAPAQRRSVPAGGPHLDDEPPF